MTKIMLSLQNLIQHIADVQPFLRSCPDILQLSCSSGIWFSFVPLPKASLNLLLLHCPAGIELVILALLLDEFVVGAAFDDAALL